MKNPIDIWKNNEMITQYLDTLRGAIPLAEIQLDIMIRLIDKFSPTPSSFLDLGCGDGILGNVILSKHPTATGTFVDFSQQFLDTAKTNLSAYNTSTFHHLDYANPLWLDAIKKHAPFDVIVSGFSIHHQPDEIKKALYQNIYSLLKKGAIFIHTEHVSSHSPAHEELHEEYFIDSICQTEEKKGHVVNKKEIAQNFYQRADKAANILAPIEQQCDWLRAIGFNNVDIPLKIFELAVFCGTK